VEPSATSEEVFSVFVRSWRRVSMGSPGVGISVRAGSVSDG
jgi:hypothetical protein